MNSQLQSRQIMKIDTIDIKSRRYLGNKYRVLPLIEEVVKKNCFGSKSFCDIFSGTGTVGNHFNTEMQIITNDILYSNYVSLNCWLKSTGANISYISHIIANLNSIKPYDTNYVSKNFGDKYFSIANANKIGEIRETIEKLGADQEEKMILLTSLLYAMDKVANTCGHYDAFRLTMDTLKPIKLLVPNINIKFNEGNLVFKENANILIKKIATDILYLDPPYNSRQYSDSYHVLENIIEWKKPKVYGKAKKMKRDHLKSEYSQKGAINAFEDLVNNSNSRYILMSYNNTGEKGNARSHSKMPDPEIIRILSNIGNVSVFEKMINNFSAGKSEFTNHKERIFFCKVKR